MLGGVLETQTYAYFFLMNYGTLVTIPFSVTEAASGRKDLFWLVFKGIQSVMVTNGWWWEH